MTKKCSKCGEIKAVELFYKRAASNDGLMPICKYCSNFKSKRFKANNKDKVSAYNKKWAMNNPRSLESRNGWRKIYPEKATEMNIAASKKARDAITDAYLCTMITSKSKLKSCDIPKDLIELKRVQILITRELRKQNGNTNNN